MSEPYTYKVDEWVVHAHYGMGRIEGVEVKGISGDEKSYYRVESKDSTFWIPVEDMESELVRPVCDPDEIQKAVEELKDEPQELSSNYKQRQSHIQKIRIRNTPRASARLVRDLLALRRSKGLLNRIERHAFQTLKQQLAAEWAIVEGTRIEKIESRINQLLNLKPVPGMGQMSSERLPVKRKKPSNSQSRRNSWQFWSKSQ
ncbi:MAG: CarD family transcriptional regulator [Candidatus Promineifilaceae bacterium]|nr:CarD family transcriptional regulator [Candidatus Promineifilaceae bacterium]